MIQASPLQPAIAGNTWSGKAYTKTRPGIARARTRSDKKAHGNLSPIFLMTRLHSPQPYNKPQASNPETPYSQPPPTETHVFGGLFERFELHDAITSLAAQRQAYLRGVKDALYVEDVAARKTSTTTRQYRGPENCKRDSTARQL